MDEKLDKGDILFQKKFLISMQYTLASVHLAYLDSSLGAMTTQTETLHVRMIQESDHGI